MGDGSALRTIKYDSKWIKGNLGEYFPIHMANVFSVAQRIRQFKASMLLHICYNVSLSAAFNTV